MASTTRYEISHVSRYLYASPVRGCVMSLCLKPRDEPGQRLLRFEIATNPLSSMNSETDCFRQHQARPEHPQGTRSVRDCRPIGD